MKVLVTGGRHYADRAHAYAVLDELHCARGITAIVHGAQTGADTLAHEWALSRGVHVIPYPADWTKHHRPGRKNPAGMIRNEAMLKERPEVVVAFAGEVGTANMCDLAHRAGVPVLLSS